MLVRRQSDAAVRDFRRLSSHILMDAGELGSRHMTVTWIEVPATTEQELHSHEEAEQVYIVVSGRGTMTVAGDKQEIAEGDLVLVPPATDHSIANGNSSDLCCVSVQSPPVTSSEVFGRSGVGVASEYDDEE